MIIIIPLNFFQQYTDSDVNKIYHPSIVEEWKDNMETQIMKIISKKKVTYLLIRDNYIES